MSQEAQPCRSFAECMSAFEDFERKTEGIFTIELSGLESLLNTIRATLDEAATKKAAVWLQQWTYICTSSSYFEQSVDGDASLPQAEAHFLPDDLPPCTCHHASDLIIDGLQDRIADQLLSTMEAFWKNRPSDLEELKLVREKLEEEIICFKKLSANHAKISRALEDAERKTEHLEVRLAASERDTTDKERLVSDRYRELERGFYDKVQKLVESQAC